jgi:hypothetical protein
MLLPNMFRYCSVLYWRSASLRKRCDKLYGTLLSTGTPLPLHLPSPFLSLPLDDSQLSENTRTFTVEEPLVATIWVRKKTLRVGRGVQLRTNCYQNKKCCHCATAMRNIIAIPRHWWESCLCVSCAGYPFLYCDIFISNWEFETVR